MIDALQLKEFAWTMEDLAARFLFTADDKLRPPGCHITLLPNIRSIRCLNTHTALQNALTRTLLQYLLDASQALASFLEIEEELCSNEARSVVSETMAPFEDQLIELQRAKDFAAIQVRRKTQAYSSERTKSRCNLLAPVSASPKVPQVRYVWTVH